MASSLKVNRVVPSTGTNIGLGTASGEIRLASTSKLTFDGDTDTYIWHPQANQIAITKGGGSYPMIRIGSGGGGNTITMGNTTSNLVTNSEILAVRGYSTFKSTNNNYAAIYTHNEGNTSGTYNAHLLWNAGGANRGGIGYMPNTGNVVINNQNALIFATGGTQFGGTERVYISNAGKIGIGTNNPSQKVSIASGRVSIDVNNDYYGVWMDGSTTGENHISVGRWYNTGGGLKSGYSQYGVNNLILENNHPTAAHTLIIQPNGQKVAIGTHVHSDDHLVAIKGTVKATDYAGDYPLSNRRINMNGDFKISQRGTSKTGITGNGRYVWDRWYWQNHGPTVTHTQDFSTVPVGQGFRTAAKIETTTAAGSAHAGNVMAMLYSWEGQDLIRLKYGSANAESLTVSFWARSSRTGVFVTTLKHDSRIISEQHTISSANTYQKYTWVIPGDTANAIGSTGANAGMSFYVYISTGTNTNSGAHMANWGGFHNAHMAAGNTLDLVTNTGTFYMTGLQVEHGEVVTPYEHIGYGDELIKCQRYYNQVANTRDQGGNDCTLGMFVQVYDANGAHIIHRLNPPMRAVPDLETTQSTSSYILIVGNNSDTFNQIIENSKTRWTNQNVELYATGGLSGLTAGHAAFIRLRSAVSTTTVAFSADI